ncbi:MAG: hypothetical protein LBP51_01110 [Deferribacteraceae bacterium]|nr:hypothetical protein [Deferribacteraceae bacterium]
MPEKAQNTRAVRSSVRRGSGDIRFTPLILGRCGVEPLHAGRGWIEGAIIPLIYLSFVPCRCKTLDFTDRWHNVRS